MGTIPRFIKVRKDNQARDRGFIAVDAICSVFENKENHNVSIMTMDGFWYDVDDDVDELYDLEADPGEKINLIAEEDQQARIAEMRVKLFHELKAHGDRFVGSDWIQRQLLHGKKHLGASFE